MSEKDRELEAMAGISAIFSIFEEEDQDKIDRILRWASDRFGSMNKKVYESVPLDFSSSEGDDALVVRDGFSDFADLFHAVSPNTDAERALAAAYWFQEFEDQREFTGREVNALLRELGHGVSNVTDALTSLMRKKPALAMQTAKKGTSKQARKRYRLTQEGIREVKSRIPQ